MYGCHDAVKLSHGKHTTIQGIAGVVAVLGVVEHGAAVVYAHGHMRPVCLKYADQFDQFAATFKVRSFYEVAIGEYLCAPQVSEVDSGEELEGDLRQVVVGSRAQ